MKKVILGLMLVTAASCEYKNIAPRLCYLASEQTTSKVNFYSYNTKNELITYVAPNIISSVLTYDDSGKIISELDNGDIQINYSYNEKNQLILWTQSIVDYPPSNLQVKFSYNTTGQDTLKEYFKYNPASSSYYLWRFVRLSYASPNTKSYSERKTYDDISTLLYTEDFVWDNHPNPYLNNAFFINEPPPSNNALQYAVTVAGQAPSVVNYSYVYNSNGFPISQAAAGYGTIAYYSYTNCN